MVESAGIPSPTKIRSFLGMVGFYQQFFEGYSGISKPLFVLTSGERRPQRTKGRKTQPKFRDLSSADWTPACSEAFSKLKQALLSNVAHPNFMKPFLLSYWPHMTLTSDTFLVLKIWWQMPSAVNLLCTPVFSIDSRQSLMVHFWRKQMPCSLIACRMLFGWPVIPPTTCGTAPCQ